MISFLSQFLYAAVVPANRGERRAFWTAGAVLSILLSLSIASANAQQRGVDSSSLGGLIDGLRVMQERGGFPGMSNQGQLLDQSRTQGLQYGQERTARAVQVELSPQEKIVAQRYCTDTLQEDERDLIPLIRRFSNIEKDYCRRVRDLIFQYGYDLFQGIYTTNEPFNGAISDSYRLGIGDELVVTMLGQESTTQRLRVDREGRMTIPRLGAIPAVGLTMSQFQRELSARVNSAFIGTESYASLGQVRQFSIVVLGEVARPGIQQVTGLSSILDAIASAGGLKKTGSLRQVRIMRGDRSVQVDLYDLLIGNANSPDLSLREGDRIIVPTLGPTIAIAGDVKRPAIYELPASVNGLAGTDAVALGGGPIRPAGAKYTRISFDQQGREIVTQLDSLNFRVVPGDIVVVGRSADIQLGSVALAGDVRVAGRRSLQSTSTIGGMIQDTNALRENAYLSFAVLSTSDAQTLSRRYFALNLRRILDGQEDYQLRDGDELIVLGDRDVRYLSSRTIQAIIGGRRDSSLVTQGDQVPPSRPQEQVSTNTSVPQPQAATLSRLESLAGELGRSTGSEQEPLASLQPEATRNGEQAAVSPQGRRTGQDCRSAVALRKLVYEARDGRFANAIVGTEEPRQITAQGGLAATADECPEIFERNPDLLSFVLEHSVNVTGEVRRPGVYPLVPETSLDAVAAIAGGLTREADLQRVELSRFAALGGTPPAQVRQLVDLRVQAPEGVLIGPGDVVRFNALFSDRDSGPIYLAGEFTRPGSYEIRRGERLSEIIGRAGGLTAQAYPYGAVFTRERVKRAEQLALLRLARELNSAVTLAAARRGVDANAFSGFTQLSRDVANAPATGRVVIEADPTVLQVRPELDVVLEPGDRIFVPKRPNSVLVTGDVLNPGAQQFVSGRRADAYIRLAGGLQRSADSGRVFIVQPNGAAQPVGVSAFNFTPVQVPPGSTIVVPKDATPFDVFTFARDIGSIVSQLAISAAALSVISNN